jgi:hypothetical protein
MLLAHRMYLNADMGGATRQQLIGFENAEFGCPPQDDVVVVEPFDIIDNHPSLSQLNTVTDV